jgi:hypothetical protein
MRVEFTIKGHEINTVHDLKKLSIVVASAVAEELQEGTQQKRKVQITTANATIMADALNLQEPDKEKLPLLSRALLESEDTLFPIINEGNIINFHGMIVLNNVKIVPFANPDNVIQYESYAVFTDHIMGFAFTE